MWLEATNCTIGVYEKVHVEKLEPEWEYVESMIVKNHAIVFYTEKSLLEQTTKRLKRKKKQNQSQKESK